jgi:Uma2 family endonuclease
VNAHEPRTRATVEDLHGVQETGKAELVNGEIVLMAPAGGIPGRAGGEIYISLRDYEQRTGRGYAFPDNLGFTVDLPHRGSFSPDAAFHAGPLRGGQFLDGAPIFAAEVRSENDYGERAEQEMADGKTDQLLRCRYPGGVGRRRTARACCARLPRR